CWHVFRTSFTKRGPDVWVPGIDPVRVLLLDDREHVAGREDEVLVALDLDLRAAVLRVDDFVPHLHVHGGPLAVLELAGADRDDLALLRLLLGRIRDHDPGDRGLLLLARL